MTDININFNQKLFGFPNPKNYCYINVILQVIIRMPNVREKLNQISAMKNQDNIEYLFYLIFKLSSEKKKFLKNKIYKNIIDFLKMFIMNIDLEIDNDAKFFYREILNVFEQFSQSKVREIVTIFEGVLENNIYCDSCENFEKYEENFKDLSLFEIKHCNPSQLFSCNFIQEYLNNYFEKVYIEDYQCPNCNTMLTTNVSKKIISSPECLVLSLNGIKSNEIGNLLKNPLEFQEFKYKIYSAVIYDELLKHYYCMIIEKEKIITFNDESVVISEKKFNGTIVLIFYLKI
jgi:hypothetical protein